MADNDDLAYAKKKLVQSRVEDGDVYPVFQSLTMDGGQDDIFLLELNPEIMKEFDDGNSLIIRGEPDEPAVMCTKSRTFELREAETSNSLLLVPDLKFPEEFTSENDEKVVHQNISGLFHTYFEVRPMRPSFKKLRSLLERCEYQGKEYEDESDSQDKFTFPHLLDIIQSSEEELNQELTQLQACTINGYVRILDFDYKFKVFSQILSVIESRSLPLDKIPKESTLQALEGIEPGEVLDACFSWFTRDTETVDDESNCKLYTLEELPVCRLYAEILLRAAVKFNLNDFLQSWQRSVPEGMNCSLEQLRGIALTDVTSKPEVIFYFPHYNLPENVSERIDHLFRIKDKWSYDEIVPFLEDRVSAIADVKSLLIKYARESTKDGVKYYSSKW